MTIMSGPAGRAAAQILDQHRPAGGNVCACGHEVRPGMHSAHVIHELQMAGLDVVWR